MFYSEKYFHRVTDRDGVEHVIFISQRLEDGQTPFVAKKIGSVIDARLEFLGQQSDIPIGVRKSSLTLTIADMSDVQDYIEDGCPVKSGNWQEFFTPDSTLYLVEYYRAGRMYWKGYITPDSYSEPLVYHGAISVTARDNIGHLADFVFDYVSSDRMARISDLIDFAFAKAGVPGRATTEVASAGRVYAKPYTGSDSARVLDLYMNLSVFTDKTWLEALEMIADSLGLFIGVTGWPQDYGAPRVVEAGFISSYLATPFAPVFLTGDAVREFCPSVREIDEQFDTDYQADLLDYRSTDMSFSPYTVTGGSQGSISSFQPAIPATGGDNPLARVGNIGTMDPLQLQSSRGKLGYDGRYLLITARSASTAFAPDEYLKFTTPVNDPVDASMKLTFTIHALGLTVSPGDWTAVRFAPQGSGSQGWYISQTGRLLMSVRYVPISGDVSYYAMDNDGAWHAETEYNVEAEANYHKSQTSGQSGSPTGAKDIEITITPPSGAGAGTLEIRFYRFIFSNSAPGASTLLATNKVYGMISNLKITALEDGWEGYTVKTKYSDSNNLRLTRSPGLGQCPDMWSPHIVKNGLFFKLPSGQYVAAGKFYISAHRSFTTPDYDLPVLIHQQILQYYARAERQISGTLAGNSCGGLILYGGDRYLPMSGSIVIGESMIEGMILRSYLSYKDLWIDESS